MQMISFSKRLNVKYLKAVLGLGIIIFLIYYIKPSNIYQTYLSADKYYLLIALLLLPLNLFLQFAKWKILTKKYFGIDKNINIWLSLLYGISGGIFTPMKSGEFFARAIPFQNVKVLDVILATMVDKFIPMYLVLFFGGIFSSIYLHQVSDISTSFVNSALIIYLAILVIIPLLLLGNSIITQKIKSYMSGNIYLQKIIPKISFFKSIDKRSMVKIVLLSLAFNLIFTLQMTILLVAFSGELNLWLFFVIANLIIFVQIIVPPIALGEVGIREGASVFFMKSYGFLGVVGFNAAFSLFIINLLIPSIIGFLLLLKRNNS